MLLGGHGGYLGAPGLCLAGDAPRHAAAGLGAPGPLVVAAAQQETCHDTSEIEESVFSAASEPEYMIL